MNKMHGPEDSKEGPSTKPGLKAHAGGCCQGNQAAIWTILILLLSSCVVYFFFGRPLLGDLGWLNLSVEERRFEEALARLEAKGGDDSPGAGVFEIIADAEVVSEIPPNPKGVLFYAHGCNHKATDFWDRGSSCPDCTGLPEDKALVKAAVGRGFAVVAVSSGGTCWDVQWPGVESSEDGGKVVAALAEWRKKNKLQSLPVSALGASSGGYFVSILTHVMDLASLCILISSGIEDAFEKPLASGKPYPPTLFVHMPKDENTAGSIHSAVKALRSRGVAAAEIISHQIPIGPHFFSDRIERVDRKMSEKLHQVLKVANELTDEGFLKTDGRSLDWHKLLDSGEILPLEFLERELKLAVDEELNLAFAFHEMTSLNSSAIMDWFEGICRLNGTSEKHRCQSYDAR